MNINVKLIFRPAKIADLEKLCDLERLCFSSDKLSRASFRHFIRSDKSELIVALSNEKKMIGYYLVLFRKNSKGVRLYSVAIHPDCQGRGLGRTLLKSMETRLKKQRRISVHLEVRPDNRGAIELYNGLGYKQWKRKENFYEDGSEAICFKKQLSPPSE